MNNLLFRNNKMIIKKYLIKMIANKINSIKKNSIIKKNNQLKIITIL